MTLDLETLSAQKLFGSGWIEGGGKNVLLRRSKINSARWLTDRAEQMGTILRLQYSGLGETYWHSQDAA